MASTSTSSSSTLFDQWKGDCQIVRDLVEVRQCIMIGSFEDGATSATAKSRIRYAVDLLDVSIQGIRELAVGIEGVLALQQQEAVLPEKEKEKDSQAEQEEEEVQILKVSTRRIPDIQLLSVKKEKGTEVKVERVDITRKRVRVQPPRETSARIRQDFERFYDESGESAQFHQLDKERILKLFNQIPGKNAIPRTFDNRKL